MKRKILAIMLSSMLAFSFTACGNTEETADGTVTNAESDVDVADTGTDVENDADRKSTRLNSSHTQKSRMPSSA